MKDFKEFISESNLKKSDLKKDLWRWTAFVDKIQTSDPFATLDGDTIVLDKSVLDGVNNADDLGKLTSDGKTVNWNKLEKTHEFGGHGSSKDPSGAQWEALICVGVNKVKGVKSWNKGDEWKAIKHFWDNYEAASILLAKDFIKTYRISELKQLGGGTAPINKEWLGTNKTPKTDMINKKVRISLKKSGGSQLMSASPAETLSTFNAALVTYTLSNKEAIHSLMNDVENDMGRMSTKGSITSIKDLRSSGKTLSPADKAKIAEMEGLHQVADDLTKKFNSIFKSMEFKSHFCFEAASGATKFKPSPEAIASDVVVFHPLGYIENTLKLDNAGKAGMYLAKNNNFYVSFKGGTQRPYLTLRTKKVKIKESFADIIREECSMLLAEDVQGLNEFQLFDKLKSSLSGISPTVIKGAKKILNAILKRIKEAFVSLKRLGDKMLKGLMDFFGIDVKSIKVVGGGPFPLV
jgi:hypothetical protein